MYGYTMSRQSGDADAVLGPGPPDHRVEQHKAQDSIQREKAKVQKERERLDKYMLEGRLGELLPM